MDRSGSGGTISRAASRGRGEGRRPEQAASRARAERGRRGARRPRGGCAAASRLSRTGLALCGCAAIAAGCTRTLHEKDFLYPRKNGVIPDGVERRNLELTAPDATRLRGWLLRPAEPRGSLVYFYGNAETIRDCQRRLYWLAGTFQLDVVAVDYRGYGTSEGVPSLELLMQDAAVVYDALPHILGREPAPVLLYGCSLGSVVALDLASRRPADGLVLESTLSSLQDALPSIKRLAPWYVRWFLRLRLGEDLARLRPPIEMMRGLATPVLVIHGDRDELFPVGLGREMFESSAAPLKRWCPVPGGRHNGLSIFEEPIRGCLDEFVSAVLPQAGPSRPAR